MHKYSEEDNRVMSNLEQVYDAFREFKIGQLNLPRYMTWKKVRDTRYLYQGFFWGEKSAGKESDETLKMYDSFQEKKVEFAEREASLGKRLNSLMSQYRALKLPLTMELPAKILQEMDFHGLLGHKFLVVGSFGFAAYEIEAGVRFLDGIEETEDFDISWKTADLPVSVSCFAR